MDGISGEGTSSDGVEHREETCSWCGKSETSSHFGGFSYCSFRCFAAGEYRNSLLIAIIVAPYFIAILLFPQIMFDLFIGSAEDSTASQNLFSVTITVLLLFLICIVEIGSFYTAYVGRSIRQMSGTEFVGHLSDAQRYPKREQYGKTHQRCEWCGEPRVDAFWSSKKGKYCSFRCNAAGNYRLSLAMLFGFFGLATIFVGMMYIMMARSESVTQIDPFLVLPLIVMAIPILSCVYVVHVGRSMNRARQMNDT